MVMVRPLQYYRWRNKFGMRLRLSSLKGFVNSLASSTQQKNTSSYLLLLRVVKHLRVTLELARAFREVNAEASEIGNTSFAHNNNNSSPSGGICSSTAFRRVMKPFLSSSTWSDHHHTTTSSNMNNDEPWLLCYLLTSRNNMMNLLDSYSCDLIYRAITVASSQLGMISSTRNNFFDSEQFLRL